MTARDPVRVFLDGIRDRQAKITPGAWFRQYGDVVTSADDPRDVEYGYDDPRALRVSRAAGHLHLRDPQAIADAEFIAAAPTTISALTGMVEAVLALADGADAAMRYLWPVSLAEHARGQLDTDAIRAAVAAHVDTLENRDAT